MRERSNNTTIPVQTPATPQTPYSAWLQTEVLHTLQELVSDHPGEMAFIVNCQVMELYWMLIVKEVQAAQGHLRTDDLAEAHRALRRVVAHHSPLNATWRSIAWMTPTDLLAILTKVAETHGKDTALQGWTYRHMVYLLGIKQEEHLQHFEVQPHRREQLKAALHAPSLYDDVLAYLHRAGFSVPSSSLERDFSTNYAPSKGVENVWREIYAEPDANVEFQHLGETLADIAEEFTTWKYRHLMATRRTFGGRPAYFGTEGLAWLVPTLDEIPFPELWTARGFIGDPPNTCPHMAGS
jgi:tryptophan 2,3-dioxygenase